MTRVYQTLRDLDDNTDYTKKNRKKSRLQNSSYKPFTYDSYNGSYKPFTYDTVDIMSNCCVWCVTLGICLDGAVALCPDRT